MKEMTAPFIRLWEYVGNVGGFPGQCFFIIAVAMLAIGVGTWISNRK